LEALGVREKVLRPDMADRRARTEYLLRALFVTAVWRRDGNFIGLNY
jgi:hypothetical protein